MTPRSDTRFVVIRTSDWPLNADPIIIGRFRTKRRAEEFAWRCGLRYLLPEVEFNYAVYPVAWEVKEVPS